jgi:hypothetical protein
MLPVRFDSVALVRLDLRQVCLLPILQRLHASNQQVKEDQAFF